MYYTTATRMTLIEHARNRMALWLIALYLPSWLAATYLVIPDQPVPFVLRASGDTLWAHGNELSQISGVLNVATQIVGFMMFSVTFKSGAFDRRLALAGYPRGHLVAAKVSVLVVLSALISGYATTVMTLFWHQQQPWLLAASTFIAASTYGAFGVLLGASVRGELEGMFLIFMVSVVDIALQNPITNHAAGGDFVHLLPTYGSMQAATAAGYSSTTPLAHLALQLVWFAGLSALVLIAFHRNTRNRSTHLDGTPSNGARHPLPAA
jgi:ABC-2 type transport system permease protein